MNRFHAQALKELTLKFATIVDEKNVSSDDKELWEYFATLYKNSNKGIKGRGKDRKVGPVVQSPRQRQGQRQSTATVPSQYPARQPPPLAAHHRPSTVPPPASSQPKNHGLQPPPSSLAAYSMSRGPVGHGVGSYIPAAPRDGAQPYEMFEVDTASHTASSSTGTLYEEEHGRDLTFGDRVY